MRLLLIVASTLMMSSFQGCSPSGGLVIYESDDRSPPSIRVYGLRGEFWSGTTPLPVTTLSFSGLSIELDRCTVTDLAWSEVEPDNALQFSDTTILRPVVTLTQSGVHHARLTVRFVTDTGLASSITYDVYLAYPPYSSI
jgi:hypothetical protein